MQQLSSGERIKLRQYLGTRFNLGELKTIAFDLDGHWDTIPYVDKLEFCRELIKQKEQEDRIAELISRALEDRKDPEIEQILTGFSPTPQVKIESNPNMGNKKSNSATGKDSEIAINVDLANEQATGKNRAGRDINVHNP